MTLSGGNYTSLAKERGVDSLFPPWTTAVGVEYGIGMRWKSLIVNLKTNFCSKMFDRTVEKIGDSLLYDTFFDILSGHMGLLLSIPRTKIHATPIIGYAFIWENMELRTPADKILQKQSYSQKGWSYGCNAEVKLFELSENSPWRPLAFLSGCCFGGRPILEEKEETEKVSAGEDKIPIYLNIGYFSIVSNQTKFMEKFSIRIIAEEFPLDLRGLSSLNFLIGTSLYLKNGKFKWWEKMFVGLGLTGDF